MMKLIKRVNNIAECFNNYISDIFDIYKLRTADFAKNIVN